MYWAFILLSALSYLAGTGFCLSCIHCTSNDGSGCSGIAKNCTGDTVCMSTVTQTATYTGQATTTLRRSCGEPQYCSAGSLSSYFITTVTNSTCCFTDSCTPPEPTMPNYKSKTKNGAVCKTCFARDERECSRFNTTMCTGSETFCVEYEVRTEAGAEAQTLECYSCLDYNDGSCSQDKAAKTSCNPDQYCTETNATLETSHNYSYLLVKGCGNRSIDDMLEHVPFYGISLHFHLSQCNSSLCNNLNTEKTIYPEKPTPEPNNVQCYSCIGNSATECSSSNVSILNCYGKYGYCFDGNVNLTIVSPLYKSSDLSLLVSRVFLGGGDHDVHPDPHRLWRRGHHAEKAFECFQAERQLWMWTLEKQK
uniref:UPAR/Ly6 domain-containing protein n=1 Tax=Xenopus tropicalis TaxID=8364 RepID=A0A803K920_XENTR